MNTRFRFCVACRWMAAGVSAGVFAASTAAQEAPVTATSLPPYRPPALALVQPPAGGSVPQDRPVIVLRFATGEPNDPIDARSLAVTVDGEDRSALFQVSLSEAWGPLAPRRDGGVPILAGPHQVVARICSGRGTCAEVTATVTVTPSPISGVKPPEGRRRDVIEFLLDAAKKLLTP